MISSRLERSGEGPDVSLDQPSARIRPGVVCLERALLLGIFGRQRTRHEDGSGAPLCAPVLWGLFAAPRAPVSVPLLGFGVKIIVFGSAAAALYATGHRTLAIVFALIVVANAVLIRLGQ